MNNNFKVFCYNREDHDLLINHDRTLFSLELKKRKFY